MRPMYNHEVGGPHCMQHCHAVVCAATAYHADGLDRQEYRKRLTSQVVPALANTIFAVQASRRILRRGPRAAQLFDENDIDTT